MTWRCENHTHLPAIGYTHDEQGKFCPRCWYNLMYGHPWCATDSLPLKDCQHSQYVEAVEQKPGGVIPPMPRKELV